MTFDELIPEADDMRAGNADYFTESDYTDEALIELNYPAALHTLKLDILRLKGWASTDTDKLDSLADTYSDRLGRVVGWKQLQLAYEEMDAGDGSKANKRAKRYEGLYNSELTTVLKLSNDVSASSNVIQIMR